MTDIRRTILWVIFGFSMVLLWDQWQVYNGHKATFFPTPGKPAVSASAPGGATGAKDLPQAATTSTAQPASPGAVPGTSAAPAVASEKVVVTTDLMRLTFDTQGGSLIGTELLKEVSDDGKSNLVLLQETAGHTYVAETGLIGGEFGS
jgi:YidC/Oxa1 family membrane protein insertase